MVIPIHHLVKIDDFPQKKLNHWLNHQDSLTEKLQAYFGPTHLTLLEQDFFLPSWWDKFTLKILDKKVFHRKIVMFAKQQPCWYAKTIIPLSCYQENTHLFYRLAHETVGSIVFSDTRITRLRLLNYAIDERCIEYHWLPKEIIVEKKPLWLRFSEFKIADSVPFYLIEILLPNLIRMIDEME